MNEAIGRWMASFVFTAFLPSIILVFVLSAVNEPIDLSSLYGRGEAYLMSAALVGNASGDFFRLLNPSNRASEQVLGWFILNWLIVTAGAFGVVTAVSLTDESPPDLLTSNIGFGVLGVSSLLALAIAMYTVDHKKDIDDEQ